MSYFLGYSLQKRLSPKGGTACKTGCLGTNLLELKQNKKLAHVFHILWNIFSTLDQFNMAFKAGENPQILSFCIFALNSLCFVS